MGSEMCIRDRDISNNGIHIKHNKKLDQSYVLKSPYSFYRDINEKQLMVLLRFCKNSYAFHPLIYVEKSLEQIVLNSIKG